MIWQSAMAVDLAEAAFRAVRSSTTITNTTAALQAGEPVVLETATASNNGQFVMRAVTQTSPVNNLYVGNVHSASIAHDSVGLVQCYGVDTDVRLVASLTAAVGDLLVPNLNATNTVITGRSAMQTQVSPNFAATATGAVTDQFRAFGAAGLAVVIEAATAVTATAGSSTVKAFIRALAVVLAVGAPFV